MMYPTTRHAAAAAQNLADKISLHIEIQRDLHRQKSEVNELANTRMETYVSMKDAFLEGNGEIADLKDAYRDVCLTIETAGLIEDAILEEGNTIGDLQRQLSELMDDLELEWAMEF